MGATDAGPGTGTPCAIRMADRKEEEAVVISVEDLARTLIDTNTFLETNTLGALDVPGIIPPAAGHQVGCRAIAGAGAEGVLQRRRSTAGPT